MIGRLCQRHEGPHGEAQRGSIMVLTAILLTVLTTFTAFAVDIGRETDLKRHLNSVADIVSQDALWALQGDSGSFAREVNYAEGSATANTFSLTGANQLQIQAGTWDGSTFTSICSTIVSATSAGSTSCDASAATATKITASTTLAWYFIGGSQTLNASAVADTSGLTGLEIGTFAARASLSSTEANFLNSLLLGTNTGAFSLTAVGYQGLATAGVNLGGLATQLGFASASSLLQGSVTYYNYLEAVGTLLDNTGQSSAGANVLGIASNFKNTTEGNSTIQVGKLLSSGDTIGSGSTAASSDTLDALDLVTGGLDLSLFNGNQAVALNNLNLGVAGIGSIQQGGLQVLQAPQYKFGTACGISEPSGALAATCANTTSAQVQAQMTLSLTPSATTLAAENALVNNVALKLLGISVSNLSITLPVFISAAQGHGWVSAIDCTNLGDTTAPVDAYAKTGALYLGLGQDASLAASTSQTNLTTGAGQSGSTTVNGTTVSDSTLTEIQLTVAGIPITVAANTDGSVTVLGDGPVQAFPSGGGTHSFSGAFTASTPFYYRGPDTVASGNVVPPTGVTTGSGTDKLQQAGNTLAAQLPNPSVSVSTGLTGSGLTVAAQSTLTAPLTTLVTDALNDVSTQLNTIESTILQPLANAVQIGLGGADLTNLADAQTNYGTLCAYPQVVQ